MTGQAGSDEVSVTASPRCSKIERYLGRAGLAFGLFLWDWVSPCLRVQREQRADSFGQ